MFYRNEYLGGAGIFKMPFITNTLRLVNALMHFKSEVILFNFHFVLNQSDSFNGATPNFVRLLV